MNTTCAQCGLPVYFAERKTSLGRNWHRACLRCEECRKVLAPGQHAEHKGKPYCHNPCYKALFGPAILGYGSNLSSPANYARRGSTNGSPAPYDYDDDNEDDPNKTEIFTFSVSQHSIQMERHLQKKKSGGSPARQCPPQGSPGSQPGQSPTKGQVKGQRSEQGQTPGSPGVARCVAAAGRDSGTAAGCSADVNSGSSGDSQGCSASPRHQQQTGGKTCATNGYAVNAKDASSDKVDPYEQEMQEKVETYNRYYTGKRRHQITVENDNGNLNIEGPLRIYWGVNHPIRLRHCDDVPAVPSPSWRHSLYPQQPVGGSTSPEDPLREKLPPSSPSRRGVDDSFLSPSSTAGVVLRRKNNIRKFNTVAYRGDRPTKWKRASINGHIYNYDTSVFTPVIGSCTSVSVTNNMTAPDVIRALLEKFKVENSPDEYYLAVITDSEGERILTSVHYPLLERINMGPDETHTKIFIKEKEVESPSRQTKSVAIEEEEEEEQHLPHEVEELLVLPEAVLTGLLQKFRNDEERAVQKVCAKYEKARKMIVKRMEHLKSQVEQGSL